MENLVMSSRKSCPKCNSSKTKKVEDRSKPLYDALGTGTAMYAKVWQCGECGHKFE